MIETDPDPSPLFFEGRTYQGARGPIYPYPIIDKLFEKSMEPQVGGPAGGVPAEKSPEEKAEDLRHFLEELRPEDFGKWNPEDL